jgi:PhnB protein
MADELDDPALASVAAALEGCPRAEFRNRLRQSLERSIEMMTSADTAKEPRQGIPGDRIQAKGVRPGFTAVTSYLMAPDIEPVIAFAKQVFGAEETFRTVGGAGGIHCELRIGDSRLMLGGGSGVYNPVIAPRLVGLHVYVDDVDTAYQRALDAGGESLGAPEDRPYGERSGFVKDAAGNHWYIARRLGPAPVAETPRTLTPHLYVQHAPGKGASELIDFLKAAFGADVEFRHDSSEGLVAHAVMRVRGGAIAIGEGRERGFAAPAAFYLYVDDCDALYARAVAAGATALHAPADQTYGDRMGSVADPWGNEWFIATHLEGPTPMA